MFKWFKKNVSTTSTDTVVIPQTANTYKLTTTTVPVTTISGQTYTLTTTNHTINWQYTSYIYCECCHKGVEVQTSESVGTRYKFFCSDECWDIYKTSPDIDE